MTKWKSLAGKFTVEEIDIIEKFMKKYEFENSNQLVRSSILSLIYLTETMIRFAKSEQARQIDLLDSDLKKMISELPQEVREPIRLGINKVEQDVDKSLEKTAQEVAKNLQSFSEKRKVGRPKTPRKHRGKPKDTGIS